MINTKNLTVNQIKNIYNDFQLRHPQLNSFYFGNIDEIDKQTYKYPLLAAIPQDVIISESPNQTRSITHKYILLFADLVTVESDNMVDTLSDTLMIAQDFISELDQYDFYRNNYIYNNNSLSLSPFTDRFDDLVTGWALTIDIVAPFINNPCTSPQTTKPDSDILNPC